MNALSATRLRVDRWMSDKWKVIIFIVPLGFGRMPVWIKRCFRISMHFRRDIHYGFIYSLALYFHIALLHIVRYSDYLFAYGIKITCTKKHKYIKLWTLCIRSWYLTTFKNRNVWRTTSGLHSEEASASDICLFCLHHILSCPSKLPGLDSIT